MMRFSTVVLIGILLTGVALRAAPLTDNVRFHVDEALFATFARDAAVHGAWMLPGALDKPPLSLYASALSMHLIGVQVNAKGVLDLDLRVGEFAARLPNVFAGVLLIALMYALMRRVAPQQPYTALAAAALTAFSPLLVAYSPTAFTDGWMLTFGAAALVASARGHGALSGALMALSFASKQQAVFLMPLAAALLIVAAPRRTRSLTRFALALAVGVAALLLWDAARNTTSLFALASVNNDPKRGLIALAEMPARLETWAGFIAAYAGSDSPLIALIMVLIAAVALWQRQRALMLMAGWALIYVVAHVVLPLNLYDRYVLPLALALIPLVAWGLVCVASRWRAAVLVMVCTGLLTAQRPFPSDHRWHDDDIITLTAYINAKPLGTIVYDHWLGWYTGYYIGAWSDKRRVYYPDAQIQAQDARLNPDRAPRLLIAPRTADTRAWLSALRQSGFSVRLDYENDGFFAYEIIPPASGA